MEFATIVRRRRMVRSFTDAPVASATLARILELAHHTTSAGFI
ncbi:MAG: nitroreductase family protein [Chloroflexales bacterium]